MSRIVERIDNLFRKGLLDIIFSSIFAELIAFIVSIFIVRRFSKDAYGYYAIAYNIYGYINVFIGCGLNNGLLQYCSENRGEGQKKHISSFCLKFGSAFNIVLMFLIPISALVFFNGMPRYYLILMSGWPFFAYLSNYYLMSLRVQRMNRFYMLANVISSIIFLVCAFILARFFDITGYVIAIYIRHISSFTIASVFLRREKNGNYINNDALEKKLKKELLRYSIICCLTNFASQILMLVDVTCINAVIGDPSVVATYKTATQIPVALHFIPTSIIVFAFPYIAENNSNYLWLKNSVKRLLNGVLVANIIISAVVILIAPQIIKILWGERYLDATAVLRLLIVNYLVSGTFNMVFGNVMVAIKKVHINLWKTVICSVLNIVLDVVFIQQYGSIGAAFATLIVSICSSAFSYIYYRIWIDRKLSTM